MGDFFAESKRPPGCPLAPEVVARTGPGALPSPVSGADGHPAARRVVAQGHRPTRNASDPGTVTDYRQTPRPPGEPAAGAFASMSLRSPAQRHGDYPSM